MRTKAGLGLGLALALAAMAASAADHAVLNLEAQASLEVPQDLGRATLYAEKEAQSASQLPRPEGRGQDGAQVMPMVGRPVMMSAKAMTLEGAAAPMESGKTLVTVTVRGSVTLD